jgi:hypothetical protein
VPSIVLLIEGFDGRLSEMPAVPVTVAVVVSVPASAAVAATSATAEIPMMMKIRCLMVILSPEFRRGSCLTTPLSGRVVGSSGPVRYEKGS